MGDKPQVEIWPVSRLLNEQRLRIPDYQRPYKWRTNNVADLVDDIQRFTPSGPYRIGTIILHQHGDVLDVVDGQQRITTLHLLARALRLVMPNEHAPNVTKLVLSPYGVEQSAARVRENSDYLRRIVSDLGQDAVGGFADALTRRCEVVVVTLVELDEAFQMFDSQNARGRALYPTDLLKAFHLREIDSAATKREVVELWEEIPAAHVNALFTEYLFKIRRWAGGRDVPKDGFTTADIGMFKGIREYDETNSENHWARPFVYAKNFTDDFHQENATLVRFRIMEPVDYPHQIDHPILNGETFFRMVAHYYRLGVRLGLLAFDDEKLAKSMQPILGVARSSTVLAPFDKPSRCADDRSRYAYIRVLLDALLLYFTDRFGHQVADRFAGLAARYVMVPRAENFAVKRETVNNYATGKTGSDPLNLFQEIREAVSAREIVNREVPRPKLYGTDKENSKDGEVVDALWRDSGDPS